ncbi:MAG: rRNA pseudouridine synthase [Deltaproteobacteria bacterium]|nr:MAG: rRNA pseudouridine synthase [Deltaproteobacteria bacterium]
MANQDHKTSFTRSKKPKSGSKKKPSQEGVRLQKVIAQAGVASRRKAEEMIEEGRVLVNGNPVSVGTKVNPSVDKIMVDGLVIGQAEEKVYLRLYKPPGYLTSMKDDKGRPLVGDLLGGVPERVFPVGRLDYNTEGVLLLTNDGILSHALTHPSNQIHRTYHVKLRGNPPTKKFMTLQSGVQLEDGMARALHVEKIRTTKAGHLWFEMILTEGRNREVRRMCEAIGHSVTRLLRVNFANINVDDLLPGEFAPLTQDQISALYTMVQLPYHPSQS